MNYITKFLKMANKYKDKILVCLVTNVSETTKNTSDYSSFSIQTEYFTANELEEIISHLNLSSFEVINFYEEIDFIKFVIDKNIDCESGLLVYCTAQKGTKIGRKSLIPAFCDLNGIPHANSNPYVVSLCRNKYHSGCILKNEGLNIPESWLFNSIKGWLGDRYPQKDKTIIMKLNNEAASIGLDQNNIIKYTESTDSIIRTISNHFKQEVLVQEFINGYEVEVPLICSQEIYPIMVIGISINNQQYLGKNILTYDIRGNDSYGFYDFSSLNPTLANEIMQHACKAASVLGIQGFGRIDFRIDSKNRFYITDIATNPHLVKHSSFFYAFSSLGFTHGEMLATLIGSALYKNLEGS